MVEMASSPWSEIIDSRVARALFESVLPLAGGEGIAGSVSLPDAPNNWTLRGLKL
jgi:hypothetical protein